ncbi:MAG: glycosyltransferase [Stigonema ocellatum SAG 48.90 = DSM 106950]|nr:glycosyltransferase [Stigonema ocellatum SAG 48.90 = DSM 106950]
MLSVITPVYNGEKFIEFCIKNVIAQKSTLVEHIIIDGGSKDRTVEIIKEYAEEYKHIRWISEKDEGQSDAMNKGIKMAKGKILGILNADDFYEDNLLNRILELFEELPEPTLLVGNCNLWDDEGKISHINKPKDLRIAALLSERSPFPYNPSAYFYHKSLHQKVGLYKVEEHYGMDIDFLIKAILVANVKYLDEIWGNYRHIEGTKTFINKQTGQYDNIHKRVLLEHRSKLPRFLAWQVTAFKIYNSAEYHTRNPQEILPNLKKKLKTLLRISASVKA